MIKFTHSFERDVMPYFGGATILTCLGEKDGKKIERQVCMLDNEASSETVDYLSAALEMILTNDFGEAIVL